MSLEGISLPDSVARGLSMFVESARAALGTDLKAVVLYGSAAEGRLRVTSDVNLIVVLDKFDAHKMDQMREPLRTAHAAIDLEAMFILENEIEAAARAFAVKFADIRQRRRVLYGADPFVNITPSRGAEIARLKQVLLNLVLRLRYRYVLSSLREEQAAAILADATGPLRTCAEVLLELQGRPASSPKLAMEQIVGTLAGGKYADFLGKMSLVRETGELPPGEAATTLLQAIDVASAMYRLVEGLE